MKITIDTKEESPEEIRKLIRMLSAMIGDSDYGSQRAPPASGEGLFNMFGDPAASTTEQQHDLFGEKGQSKTEQFGSGSSGQGSTTDINEFIGKSSDPDKPGSEDDDMKVVPY